jgi:3-(3-hydroxy-phenyl)propionate hydroxylase
VIPATCEVLIVGAGPTGLTLANLLGMEGVATILIERNPGCVPEPRAIALDGESLRTLQATGLTSTILPTIKQGFIAEYVNGEGTHLFSTDMTARPYGFCLQNSFDQPTLEKQLLAGLQRFTSVSVHHSMEMVEFLQDDSGVSARLLGPEGARHNIRAGFMVGCDGGRSSVRQSLGIPMLGDRLPQKWLVVDTVDQHLTAEPECRFFCDPARPAMTLLRPHGERRWEWMLLDGESDTEMLDTASINQLLAAHTDPAKVDVYRKCVYGFSAVVAERFSEGRVFLAGDAAHMTPPFAGQGLNAGVRDVRNLSWKLARVLNGSLPPGLLDTYNLERRDAASAVVELAVALGDQIQPTDPAAAAARDAMFAELNNDPAAAAAFSKDTVAAISAVQLAAGWFSQNNNGGPMLPQPEVSRQGESVLLDNLLGSGFSALVHGPADIPRQISSHPLWRAIAPRVLHIGTDVDLPAGALQAVVDLHTKGITLIRPDRFVLATLDPQGQATATLDALQAQLASAAA